MVTVKVEVSASSRLPAPESASVPMLVLPRSTVTVPPEPSRALSAANPVSMHCSAVRTRVLATVHGGIVSFYAHTGRELLAM